MVGIIKTPDTQEKLSILSTDAQYDLACACGTNELDRRHRSEKDKWVYPVTLPNGGHSVLFKTLVSNVCVNDCKYCPLRHNQDPRRCTLNPEETVDTFMGYLKAKKVFGLFLSSGIIGTPDNTMDHLIAVARRLRQREQFRGYIHLKILPGASDAAITEAISLSSAVSLNIETAGEDNFSALSDRKSYMDDIIRPMKLISSLTSKGSRYSRVKQSTQFVVGAAGESDRDLVHYSWGLYRKLNMNRVYYSAYQRGLGESSLPGEQGDSSNADLLTREHRLYQVDFLMRKYGFQYSEIPFGKDENLSLSDDPKAEWAKANPGFFPVNVNTADKMELLRVPGLGPVTVNRILKYRSERGRIHTMAAVSRPSKRLNKAAAYITF